MKPLILLALTLLVLAPPLCAETIIGHHPRAAVDTVATHPDGALWFLLRKRHQLL